ncbi:MAG TPA: hypothetical protein PLZ51_27565, partial [Aggregatilineales bacterium]|nr:hypothetical protein [Aggregatilineales bacterium]
VNAVAWAKSGNRIASGSMDNSARVWDAFTGKVIKVIFGHTKWVNDVALDMTGNRLITASADSTVILWDVKTGEQIHKMGSSYTHMDCVVWD